MIKSLQTALLALALVMVTTAGCSAREDTAAETAAAETAAGDAAAAMASQAATAAEASIAGAAAEDTPATVAASYDEEAADEPVQVAQADTAAVEPGQAAPAKPDTPAPYRVGDHYSVLTPAQPTSASPGKIDVTEAFMYGCPHCFSFEPYVEEWLKRKDADIEFTRIPALFNRAARIHARVFYTAETLGILDETHMAFYQELHVNRKAMTEDDDIAAFFERFGVDREKFRQTFNSFAVDTKMRRAEALGRRYRITSTPMIVVNGKYLVDGDKITSYRQILDVADYLAAQESGG